MRVATRPAKHILAGKGHPASVYSVNAEQERNRMFREASR